LEKIKPDGTININGGYANSSVELAPVPSSKFTTLVLTHQLIEIDNKFSQNML
jgi:hypothetical protein